MLADVTDPLCKLTDPLLHVTDPLCELTDPLTVYFLSIAQPGAHHLHIPFANFSAFVNFRPKKINFFAGPDAGILGIHKKALESRATGSPYFNVSDDKSFDIQQSSYF